MLALVTPAGAARGLLRSGVIGASTCARPRSTAPASCVRILSNATKESWIDWNSLKLEIISFSKPMLQVNNMVDNS